MSTIRWVLLGILSFMVAACAGQAMPPTPMAAATTAVPAAATTTPTVVAAPTVFPTDTPVATATPTPAAKSEWRCDPSGGVACFDDLMYVSMQNPEEGWAYGEHGVVLHYAPSPGNPIPSWQLITALNRPLKTLKMVSPTEGWGIIGGQVSHYQDGKWDQPGGLLGDFYDVDMLDANEGWAVGYAGRIYHFRQDKWQPVSSPTKSNLGSVAIVSSEEAWAVGLEGVLLHYHDLRWEKVAFSSKAPPTPYLYDIKMLNPNEGWIVGDTILHYRNGTWQEVTPLGYEKALFKMSFVGTEEAWAVGRHGTMFHYRQGQWQAVNSPTGEDLRSVDMLNASEGWAVGQHSTVLHYHDGQWELVSESTPSYESLNDLAWLKTGEVWAVGANSTILRYSAGKWQQVVSPQDAAKLDTTLEAIDMISPEEGWAVGFKMRIEGGGSILHYGQGKWQLFPGPTTEDLRDLDMLDEQEGWAVGGKGTILHYFDGRWQASLSPTSQWLNAIDMLDKEEGWAVGSGDTVLHYQNGSWQQIPPVSGKVGVAGDLYDIDMADEKSGWAVGYGGLILRYQNGTWQQVDGPVGDNLVAVVAVGINEAWASGGGKILHYQDGAWKIVDRPGVFDIRAIVMLNDHEGWAVGDGILHYTNK